MQILLGISSRVDFLMVHIPKFVLIGRKVAEHFFEQILTQLLVRAHRSPLGRGGTTCWTNKFQIRDASDRCLQVVLNNVHNYNTVLVDVMLPLVPPRVTTNPTMWHLGTPSRLSDDVTVLEDLKDWLQLNQTSHPRFSKLVALNPTT